MKKYLFLVATLLLTMSMTVSAQNNRRNLDNRRGNIDNRRSERIMKMTPKERADLMAKELDLTAEQSAQVQTLCEKQDAERLEQVAAQRSQRGTGTQNRDARREEFRAMREKEMQAQNEELEKIIGKEKADKWNEIRQDVRDTNRAGRRNPGFRNR